MYSKFTCIKDFDCKDSNFNIYPLSYCNPHFEKGNIYNGYLTYTLDMSDTGKLFFIFQCVIYEGNEEDVDGYDRRIAIGIESIDMFNQYFIVVE